MPPSVDDAAFSIRFTVTDPASYDELHVAVRRALGLADHVVFKYTMVRGIEPSALRGQAYDGFARIVKVTGKTVDGNKVAMVAYEFYYRLRGEIVRWSSSLDPTVPGGGGKPDTLWFKDGAAPVLLTPELVARAKS